MKLYSNYCVWPPTVASKDSSLVSVLQSLTTPLKNPCNPAVKISYPPPDICTYSCYVASSMSSRNQSLTTPSQHLQDKFSPLDKNFECRNNLHSSSDSCIIIKNQHLLAIIRLLDMKIICPRGLDLGRERIGQLSGPRHQRSLSNLCPLRLDLGRRRMAKHQGSGPEVSLQPESSSVTQGNSFILSSTTPNLTSSSVSSR